jgi:hypothetical protein
MESVSMNDIAGAGGSRQKPFGEEPEDDAHASRDTVRAVIQRQLRGFDSTEDCRVLQAILEDAYLSKSSSVDLGSFLQLCFDVIVGSKSSALEPPCWRFPIGRQYLITKVQTLPRPRFQFCLAILEHLVCSVQDSSSAADWGDVVGTATPESPIAILLKKRGEESKCVTQIWTLTNDGAEV